MNDLTTGYAIAAFSLLVNILTEEIRQGQLTPQGCAGDHYALSFFRRQPGKHARGEMVAGEEKNNRAAP